MYPKKFTFLAVVFFIAGCSYTGSPSNYSEGSDVGGTGDIKYDHEALGGGKHFLTVTAAPGIMETEGSIAQRIHIFANKYAARTCPKSFEFVHDPNFDQSLAAGFMKRTKSYVFQCES
tara:strand:+ start:981 stop:1334 length:354 start_codon:yes stop_codon:yes gene_type:complete